MKRGAGFWLPVVGAFACGVGVMVWQSGEIERVREEVLSRTIVGGVGGLGASVRVPDEGKVRAEFSMEAIVEMAPTHRMGWRGSALAMLEVMEALEGASVDQLLEVIVALSEVDDPERPLSGDLVEMLLMAVAEENPWRVLGLADDGKVNADRARERGFAVLVRKDLAGARRLLEECDWTEEQLKGARCHLVKELVRTDVEAAMDFLREREPPQFVVNRDPMLAAIAGTVGDAVARERLLAALGEEENRAMARTVGGGVVGSQFAVGGIAGVKDLVGRLEFVDEKVRVRMAQQFMVEGMEGEPDLAYAWIRETGDPAVMGETLGQAIRGWAGRDFNVAGEWLGAQEESPERDVGILAFVETVVKIDAEAAVRWAGEIGDEGLREAALEVIEAGWRGE